MEESVHLSRHGWGEKKVGGENGGQKRGSTRSIQEVIAQKAEPFGEIETSDIGPLMDRIGNARLVLMGEASHGTSEFYRMRQRITRELIESKGFTILAVEADWPDAEHVDEYVSGRFGRGGRTWQSFGRFPAWMWRNREVYEFVEWMRGCNHRAGDPALRVGFYGLDLYSMYTSMAAVIRYLSTVDPDLADLAVERYSCFAPFASDPVAYGRAVTSRKYQSCEPEAMAMLSDLYQARRKYSSYPGEGPNGRGGSESSRSSGNDQFDAEQNARTVAGAEKYYREMFYGASAGWNLRDRHMFETLEALLKHRGPDSKAVVWAHNSHIGDASATYMHHEGQINIGQLCRERYPDETYVIGFGTHTGTVAAASSWGGAVQFKHIRPSHPNSYERLCHECGIARFMLPLRSDGRELQEKLAGPRLERAIGVIYRPESELQSHYFTAVLPDQFDELIWFDETQAVQPFRSESAPFMPSHHPFYLVD